jgi:hypothetical protein
VRARDFVPTVAKRALASGYSNAVLALKRLRWHWRVTRAHYVDFGEDRELVGDDLVGPQAWDALRVRSSGVFALPDSRAEWERLADERADLRHRAQEIDRWLNQRGVLHLASYGVGSAILECWLKRLTPERRLALGEYAPATVERLHEFFPDSEVRDHDLLRDPPLDAEWHLFHRIDTEFSNSDWRRIFAAFGRERVLFVVSELLTPERNAIEVEARKQAASWAGYLRNHPGFEALWRRTHSGTALRFYDLEAWCLRPRS